MPIDEKQVTNKQHAVPQNIMDVDFKIIGDLTLREFIYLLIFFGLAYWVFITVNLVVKWPLVLFFVLVGVIFARGRYGERGMDEWVVNFLRAIYNPTQKIWRKTASIPVAFTYQNLDFVKNELITLAPTATRRKLENYLESYNAIAVQKDDFEQLEEDYIRKVSAFNYNVVSDASQGTGVGVVVDTPDEPSHHRDSDIQPAAPQQDNPTPKAAPQSPNTHEDQPAVQPAVQPQTEEHTAQEEQPKVGVVSFDIKSLYHKKLAQKNEQPQAASALKPETQAPPQAKQNTQELKQNSVGNDKTNLPPTSVQTPAHKPQDVKQDVKQADTTPSVQKAPTNEQPSSKPNLPPLTKFGTTHTAAGMQHIIEALKQEEKQYTEQPIQPPVHQQPTVPPVRQPVQAPPAQQTVPPTQPLQPPVQAQPTQQTVTPPQPIQPPVQAQAVQPDKPAAIPQQAKAPAPAQQQAQVAPFMPKKVEASQSAQVTPFEPEKENLLYKPYGVNSQPTQSAQPMYPAQEAQPKQQSPYKPYKPSDPIMPELTPDRVAGRRFTPLALDQQGEIILPIRGEKVLRTESVDNEVSQKQLEEKTQQLQVLLEQIRRETGIASATLKAPKPKAQPQEPETKTQAQPTTANAQTQTPQQTQEEEILQKLQTENQRLIDEIAHLKIEMSKTQQMGNLQQQEQVLQSASIEQEVLKKQIAELQQKITQQNQETDALRKREQQRIEEERKQAETLRLMMQMQAEKDKKEAERKQKEAQQKYETELKIQEEQKRKEEEKLRKQQEEQAKIEAEKKAKEERIRAEEQRKAQEEQARQNAKRAEEERIKAEQAKKQAEAKQAQEARIKAEQEKKRLEQERIAHEVELKKQQEVRKQQEEENRKQAELKRKEEQQAKERELKAQKEKAEKELKEAEARAYEEQKRIEAAKKVAEEEKRKQEEALKKLSAATTPAFAKIQPITQTPNALSGVVKGKDGKTMEGVLVLIKRESGEPVRALKTNILGQFAITTPLSNGVYLVEVDNTGSSGQKFDIIKVTTDGKVIPPLEFAGK